MNWKDKFSADAEAIHVSEIRELLKIIADPEILSFAGGIPDPEMFPVKDVAEIRSYIESRSDLNRQSMQYSPTEGYEPLRGWVCQSYSTDHISLRNDNVLITNGAQQSLTLLATALIDSGDSIAVANPTYLGALQVFEGRRPRYAAINTDNDGLVIDSLEAAFKNGVKVLYTIPDFQTPAGMTIPEDRRWRIIELAHWYEVIIIEDTAYRDLYYDRLPPASLLQIEGEFLNQQLWHDKGLVVQLGTTSKTLMPALRVGWTIAPRTLLNKLITLKQANDLCSSNMNQILAHELVTKNLNAHVAKLRGVYRERRDAMVDALRQHLPNNVTFAVPSGGMFVWLTLPEGMDAHSLLEKSITEEKIAFVPGSAFHANGGGENTLRLSFSTCRPGVIRDAMKRLSKLISKEHRG